MLSILIPEHNYDCSKLVHGLAAQCTEAGIPYEIIVWDDASTLYLDQNRRIREYPGCILVESDQNLGSGRVRNRLARMAAYPHLLMMDCDAELVDEHYIRRYLEVSDRAQVIIGGVSYSPLKPSPDRLLRWHYGRHRECPSARVRNLAPHNSFLSFNLMMDKDVLLSHPYDENFKDYGHEDSVLGFTLKQAGIKVLHIDNPLIHNGLDLNEAFLKKSRKAVEKYVSNPVFQIGELVEQIKIFRVFRKIKTLGLNRFLAFKFRIFRKSMERNLTGKHPSLFIYDLYRLGYLCHFFINSRK
jgi:glycosyltransferase involved in cell wall biosynthesis